MWTTLTTFPRALRHTRVDAVVLDWHELRLPGVCRALRRDRPDLLVLLL